MKVLLRWILHIYPRTWRDRYQSELEQLIDDADPRPSDIFDMLGSGLVARARPIRSVLAGLPGGADVMVHRSFAHPIRLATMGLVIVLPTAVLVLLALLKYVVGVGGPFDAIEPTVTPFVTHPLGETFLTLAPYVAFLLTVLPVARLELGWREGRATGRLELAAPAFNLLVAGVCVGLIVFMGIYWLVENF